MDSNNSTFENHTDSQKIKHLAIIMDGNARWAQQNNTTKSEGHKKGMLTAEKITKAAAQMGISYLTLYAFSSENWSRPDDEIETLMELFKNAITKDIDNLNKQGIRLKVIGNLKKFDEDLQDGIKKAVKYTENNTKMTLALAISYGGREEITSACKSLIAEYIKKGSSIDAIEQISENDLAKHLYDPEMPDVDLFIRTSNRHCISNFLLWQSVYAEILFLDKLWPDFTEEDLTEAVKSFSSRRRHFGRRIESK